jgi:hypothetical protein
MKFSLLNLTTRKLLKNLALVVPFVFVIGHSTCSIYFLHPDLECMGENMV